MPRTSHDGIEEDGDGISSELVLIDKERLVVAATSPTTPYVTNLNVSNSSRVHIGPRYINITQNIQRNEVIAGQVLGFELISPRNRKKLRCSLVVVVFWALVLSLGLALYFLEVSLTKPPVRIDIGINSKWYLRRSDWQAWEAYRIQHLETPVRYVIIGHITGYYCKTHFECIKNVIGIQMEHMSRQWDDIGPNYLVGGDAGYVFEGRGGNVLSTMARSWIHGSITIMFLVDSEDPLDLPFHKYVWNVVKNTTKRERVWCCIALAALLICSILVLCFTLPKDLQIMDLGPSDLIITQTMWLSTRVKNITGNMSGPVRLVIVQETSSIDCDTFAACAAEMRHLQKYSLKAHHYDVPYNFVIGNDGRVYEGRGWNKVGAHTDGYNRCSLGIGFFGDYREEIPSHTEVKEKQMTSAEALLKAGVELGYLHPEYHLVGAKDLKNSESPGSHLYRAIQLLPHYDHQAHYRGLSCDQIHALNTLLDT